MIDGHKKAFHKSIVTFDWKPPEDHKMNENKQNYLNNPF